MPLTISASKAFPSSSNSSTLSESEPARFDKPCRSPDWPPERAPRPVGSNTTASPPSLLPRGLALLIGVFFFVGDFLTVASFLAGASFFTAFRLGAFRLGAAFRLKALLGLIRFFVLFLVAMPGVYH